MNRRLLIIFWSFWILGGFSGAKAAAPDWNVNPHNYQFLMSVTAELNVNCNQLENDLNMLGAFVGETCVGKGLTNVMVGDNHLAFLTVYANVASGDIVTFKCYDAVNDVVVDMLTTVVFHDGDSWGTPDEPLQIINNDPPTDLNLSAYSMPENIGSGEQVALMMVDDVNSIALFSYVLIAGEGDDDNDAFLVDGDKLLINEAVNFELQASYSIRLRSEEVGGCFIEKSFVLDVVDNNEFPYDLALSVVNSQENLLPNSFTGLISAEDEDAADVLSFALVPGTGDDDNAAFIISNDTLYPVNSFNYEVQNSYAIRLEVADGNGGTQQAPFVILVEDVNDTIVDFSMSTLEIAEQSPQGALVGEISIVDEDPDDTHSYTFVEGVGGEDNAYFSLIDNQLKIVEEPNYEIKSSYSLLIQADDNQGSLLVKNFVIDVLDINDIPDNLSFTLVNVEENLPLHSATGILSATDEDAGAVLSYALVAGEGDGDNSQFFLVNDTLFPLASFNYEVQAHYSVRVRVQDDAGAETEQPFTFNVVNINDKPVGQDISFNVDERAQKGSVVGVITASDEDIDQTLSFTFLNEELVVPFALDALTGNLSVTGILSYATMPQYDFEVLVSDNGEPMLLDTLTVKVIINDIPDAPYNLAISNNLLAENESPYSFVAQLTAMDDEPVHSADWSLVTGAGDDDNDWFTISHDSLFSLLSFDYETQHSFTIRVAADDANGGVTDAVFTLGAVDVNEKPIAETLASEIVERSAVGTEVGYVPFSDQDGGQEYAFTIIGDESLPFAVDLNSGMVTVNNSDIIYTQQSRYEFDVLITDNGAPQLCDTARVEVNILDVIDDKLPVNNFISPNDDGINDSWQFISVDLFRDFEITIFNGAGMEVFHVDRDYQNEFNGTAHGVKLPDGAYYYVVRNKQIGRVYKGTLSIVR